MEQEVEQLKALVSDLFMKVEVRYRLCACLKLRDSNGGSLGTRLF